MEESMERFFETTDSDQLLFIQKKLASELYIHNGSSEEHLGLTTQLTHTITLMKTQGFLC